MAYRYVVTRPWGEHHIGERLESVDADHEHFVVRVLFSDAQEPPAEAAAEAHNG